MTLVTTKRANRRFWQSSYTNKLKWIAKPKNTEQISTQEWVRLTGGKIIQSDDKMSLQETTDGIVLHRVGNLTVGKNYTLSHDDKTYSVQQDYEIRIKNQESREKLR